MRPRRQRFLQRKDGLHRAEACGIDPAHLSRADAYGLAMAFAEPGIDDRVRFDVFADSPGEEQSPHLLRCRLSFGDDLKFALANAQPVGILHQQTTRDLLQHRGVSQARSRAAGDSSSLQSDPAPPA